MLGRLPERFGVARGDLHGAHLSGATLADANLFGAHLSGATLADANLFGARLDWANLSDADLGVANMSDADLFEANLTGADLGRANLTGARHLTQDQLNSARGGAQTQLPEGLERPSSWALSGG